MARTQAKDYDHKTEHILNEASKVFATIGFDRASMNLVASACEFSKATLYHYFPSKNSILYAILDRHLKGLRNHIDALQQGTRNTEEYFTYMVEEILVFYRGNDDIHELQMHALGQLCKEDQSKLRGYMHVIVEEVTKKIDAVHPNALDSNHLRMATMSLFGMLNWYYTWNRGRGIERRREYARYAARILLQGAY